MNPPPEIEPILEELDDTARRAAWTDSALVGAGGVLAASALAVVLAELGWVGLATGAMVLLAIGSLVLVVVLARRLIAQETHSRLNVAGLAEELVPELGSSARTAVDLHGRLEGGEFSRDLAVDHVHRTARRLEKLDLGSRYLKSRRPRRQRAGGLFAGLGLVAVLLWVTLDTGRERLLAFLQDPSAARVSDVPLTGDISITYSFPAYTGLSPRTVPGGDGSITAVVGTQVTLEAVSDREVRSAMIKLTRDDEAEVQEIPLEVEDGRKLKGELSVLESGTYFFELETSSGERLEDRVRHPITAELDEYPVVRLDSPSADVELKDDREVDIVWGASDDFGVGEVALVVDVPGSSEPKRVVLEPAETPQKRREGRYRWSVAELELPPGAEARFFIEAVDNDTITGPKKATSSVRKLVIFSARERHRELVENQREIMDQMVDHLALELENTFEPKTAELGLAVTTQKRIIGSLRNVSDTIDELVAALRDDQLSGPEVAEAFSNIGEHMRSAERRRERSVQRVEVQPKNNDRKVALATAQAETVEQVERDIIYLDDLVALQKIDELKQTAEDLLSAQRELREKLEQYKETKDPGLRAELEREIRQLREKMMNMLARMGDIKRQLPGEYRNMEAGQMMEMDDQLNRLEEMLKEGNLEDAAAELEELANMIENMVNNINEAGEQFGDERYSEMREEMQKFSNDFRQLQAEQQALSERAEKLEKEYRKRSIQQAGKNLDDVVKKARKLVKEATQELEQAKTEAPFLFGQLGDQLNRANQRLSDLDSLLEQKDLAEARRFGGMAENHLMWAESYLRNRAEATREPQAQKSWESGQTALEKTREVNDLLDKLFPDPNDIMSQAERQQMERMARKQERLQERAGEMSEQMQELAEQMPVFGQEPRDAMARAQQEMGNAVQQMREGQLPGAAASKKKALEELNALQESMQQASQRSGGRGMPMPLAGNQSRGQRPGQGDGVNRDPVELPSTDRNRANPSFRQELLEAAKQKAPNRYEDATRRYYEELIR
ncbi:MAG: DUF4175 family protein [Myxococcota bacterium]